MSAKSSKPLPELIIRHRDELERLCREFGVARLEIFGSAGTDDFNPETSDLDFLIDFKPDFDLGPWMTKFVQLNEALESLFGRDVDLVFLKGIRNPVFKRNIEDSRTLLYAA